MPPRSRVAKDLGDSITDACDLLQRAKQLLSEVDLSTAQSGTRENLLTAQEAVSTAVTHVIAAIRAEVESMTSEATGKESP